jgi:hypothetical protein
VSIRSFGMKRGRHRGSKWPERTVLVVFAALAVTVLVFAIRNVRRQDALLQWRQSLESEAKHPPWPAWSSSWPELPVPPARRHRLPQDLHGAYAYAATHRDTLKRIPCFCGCAQMGHTSALDCFVERFRGDGTPVWNAHSFDCDMCVHIAREVMLMESRGLTAPRIRAAIEEQYGHGHVSTPTPRTTGPAEDTHEHAD